MKQRLYKETDRITSPYIRKYIQEALNNAHDQFWLIPSSSSGKYHPPEDQGQGGLIRHSIKASEIAYELANFYNISEEDRDIVVGSAMIHDIQKNGIPWGEHTVYDHGLIAYHWLDKFSLKNPYKDKIRKCVRFHMSRWCSPKSEIKRACRANTNELIVQLSDYMSSRKGASFLPGISLGEDIINKYGN